MDRQNNQYQIDDECQIDREKLSDLIRRIRELSFVYHDSYHSAVNREYILQPDISPSYSRRYGYKTNWKFTPQPEDDEGMSDDDLEESQKMLFDFLGVSE